MTSVVHKCGLYCRVSTVEQVTPEGSLKNQLARLHRFVAAKQDTTGEDWIVVKEYIEEKTAKDTNRPKFKEMSRDVEDGVIDLVMFTELSRLSRSVRDFLDFGQFLKDHDAAFICISNSDVDTSTAAGKILFVLISALAEFERDLDSERAIIAYGEKAIRGLWTGGQILGYDLDPKQHGHLIVNEEEAKIVSFIFQSYLRVGSAWKVAEMCNQRGFKTKSYVSRREKTHVGGRYSYSSVKQTLANQAYAGVKEIHKKLKLGAGKKDQKAGKEHKVVPTTCWKAIIAPKTFDAVQRKLEESHHTRSTAGESKGAYDYLFGQLLTCGACKSTLTNGGTQKPGGLIPHYVHRQGMRLEECPLPPNVNAKRLDEAVWKRISKDVDLDAVLAKAELERQDSEADKRQVEESIAQIQRSIRDKRKKHAAILDGFEGGKMDAATKQSLQELSDQADDLAAQLEAERARLARVQAAAEDRKALPSAGRRKSQPLSSDLKRVVLRDVIEKIVLHGNAIVVERKGGVEPIVGEVLPSPAGTRSSPWRFLDVKWDD